jgi:hypothetical protein
VSTNDAGDIQKNKIGKAHAGEYLESSATFYARGKKGNTNRKLLEDLICYFSP